MGVAFRTLEAGSNTQVAMAGPVLLVVMRGRVELATIARLAKLTAEESARQGRKLGSLTVQTEHKDSASAGTETERGRFRELLRDAGAAVAANAVVVQQRGFPGAAMRAFVKGAAALARTSFPLETFDEEGDALDWLLPRSTQEQERPAVRAALERALRSFAAA